MCCIVYMPYNVLMYLHTEMNVLRAEATSVHDTFPVFFSRQAGHNKLCCDM